MTKSIPRITLITAAMMLYVVCSAQSIHFNFTNGTQEAYNVVDVRKITYDIGALNLHLLDGSIYSWELNALNHFRYETTSIGVEEWLSDANAREAFVFPNPASDALNVSYNLPRTDDIKISLFDSQGKEVLSTHIGAQPAGHHQQKINVAAISEGPYVCRIAGKYHSISKKIVIQ